MAEMNLPKSLESLLTTAAIYKVRTGGKIEVKWVAEGQILDQWQYGKQNLQFLIPPVLSPLNCNKTPKQQRDLAAADTVASYVPGEDSVFWYRTMVICLCTWKKNYLLAWCHSSVTYTDTQDIARWLKGEWDMCPAILEKGPPTVQSQSFVVSW